MLMRNYLHQLATRRDALLLLECMLPGLFLLLLGALSPHA